MTVQEYSLKFSQLTLSSLNMVSDSRAHTNSFVSSVSKMMGKECMTPMLIKEIEICRLMTNAQIIK